MPELPDLEVFATNLSKKLKGREVTRVKAPVSKKLNVSVNALKKAIEHDTVNDVYREGKELHIAFKNGHVLGLHLMLHGKLYLFDGTNEHKHSLMVLLFDNDTGLTLTDWQGMATPTLDPKIKDSPDALSKEVNFKFLRQALDTRAIIKNVLLDQDVIRGIGNAYADEILWDAEISPFSIANKIPDTHIRKLAKSIKKVLLNAEKQIRKANPDIISGEFRDFLLIHNAKQKQSPAGVAIQQKVTAGRKTYYTLEQELFK